MRIPTTFLLATLLIAAPDGQALDYRAEIMAEVIDRCYPATVHFRLMLAGRTGRIDASDAEMAKASVAMVKALKAEEHTERFITSLAEVVREKDWEERKRLYDIAYVNCFVSGGEL